MKKAIVALVAAIGLCGASSQAGFYIQWDSAGGAVGYSGFGALSPNAGDEALVQLVFAGSDGLVDPVLFNDFSTGGDDVVIDSLVIVSDGASNTFGQWGSPIYGDNPNTTPGTPWVAPGNVYVRVFANNAVDAGTLYWASSTFASTDVVKPAIGDAFPEVFQPLSGQFVELDVSGSEVQLIPEPMSFAMLLVGAMTVFVRHRRRQ